MNSATRMPSHSWLWIVGCTSVWSCDPRRPLFLHGFGPKSTFFQEHSPLRRRGRRRREKLKLRRYQVSLKLEKDLVKRRRLAHFAIARIGAREHCAVPAIHYIQMNIKLIQNPHRYMIDHVVEI